METPSYFGRKLSGGANSSAGFNYQDICAIICFFERLNRKNIVNSLGVETINDFVIHQENKTISTQVKKRTLTISDVKKILRETYTDSKHIVMITASHFHDDLDQLIKKRDQFRDVMESNLDDLWKQNIVLQFNRELAGFGLEKESEFFIQSEFRCFPERTVDAILLATVWTWTEQRNISINIPQFINSLKVKVQSLRSERGHLLMEDIDELIKVHSIQSVASRVIKEIYQSKVIESSQILSVLGDTQESILKPLEEKLQVADDLIKKDNYRDALDIYKSLATLYPKEEIYLQCAMLNELCNEYDEAIKYSNCILTMNRGHFAANLIKGTSLGALELYPEAILQLERTLLIKSAPEVYYNLGYILWLTGESKMAIEYYNSCLKLDDKFTSAHLNISICYFETMNYKKSLYHINQAICLDPNMYQAYARKGELYRFLGLYDDAIVYFEECLSRDKTNYQSLLGIAFCFVEKGSLSEASIQFKKFFNHYYDQFFQSDDKIGKKVGLIDIGWKRTLFATIELSGENKLNVYVNNTCLHVNTTKSTNFIFIGSIQLSDDTGIILYPSIGKIYENNKEYREVINFIKNSGDLHQVFNKPLYFDFEGNIKVNVKEREKYVLIEIIFGNNYQISGRTDKKSGGLESFLEYLNKYKQYRIHLECTESQEVFIIETKTNINIDLLE
ncbi:tetratricopeptide repeat protein [Peribacillus frigoritolerans]